MDKGVLWVISGPSGAGKGTLCHMMMQRCPQMTFSVSATTRTPREGEVDGVDYFFIDNTTFARMIQNQEFLEYAELFGAHCYGTPRSYVQQQLDSGADVILEIDVQGAMQVKRAMPEAVLVFIVPQSMDILEQRLRDRGTETEEQIEKRLRTANKEVSQALKYDYIVVNDDLQAACERFYSIWQAEKARANRHESWLYQNWRADEL